MRKHAKLLYAAPALLLIIIIMIYWSSKCLTCRTDSDAHVRANNVYMLVLQDYEIISFGNYDHDYIIICNYVTGYEKTGLICT